MELKEQIKSINPSAKDPLFRRIMLEEDLGYLRNDDKIIGFEIDQNSSKHLSGYTMIAIQKHTILAMKSDLDEDLRLILFPSMDKLFDEAFELLDLSVIKYEFSDSTFVGKKLDQGVLRSVVSDLTPPLKNVDLPQGVSEAMVAAMLEENEANVRNTKRAQTPKPIAPKPTKPAMSTGQHSEPESSGTVDKVQELRDKKFTDLNELADFVVMFHGIPREVATQVLTGSLRASTNPNIRIDVAIQLFGKIYEKLGVK